MGAQCAYYSYQAQAIKQAHYRRDSMKTVTLTHKYLISADVTMTIESFNALSASSPEIMENYEVKFDQ